MNTEDVMPAIAERERLLLVEHSQQWADIALRTRPIERDMIVPAMKKVYAVAGLPEPNVVVVSSPLIMIFAWAAAVSKCKLLKQDPTRSRIYNGVVAAVVEARTGERCEVLGGPGKEYDAVLACRDIAGRAALRIAPAWSSAYQGGNVWAGYECYLTGARDVLGLRLPEHDAYHHWEMAARHGGPRMMADGFCMVSDFPETIRRDEEGRPHAPAGMTSHLWRDGWCLYYWHGVRIPTKWGKDIKSVDPAEILRERNSEVRRAGCEMIGWDRIIEALGGRVIDADPDPEIGTLIEVNIPDSGKDKFLRVKCGTGRMFAKPVPREMKTALDAQAWIWDLDGKSFIPPETRT